MVLDSGSGHHWISYPCSEYLDDVTVLQVHWLALHIKLALHAREVCRFCSPVLVCFTNRKNNPGIFSRLQFQFGGFKEIQECTGWVSK